MSSGSAHDPYRVAPEWGHLDRLGEPVPCWRTEEWHRLAEKLIAGIQDGTFVCVHPGMDGPRCEICGYEVAPAEPPDPAPGDWPLPGDEPDLDGWPTL